MDDELLEFEAAGSKAALKTLNLKKVNDMIDQVISIIGKDAETDPELKAAVGTLLAAKRLIKTYSNRILSSPFKSRYEGFFKDGEGFDSPSTIFNKKRKR